MTSSSAAEVKKMAAAYLGQPVEEMGGKSSSQAVRRQSEAIKCNQTWASLRWRWQEAVDRRIAEAREGQRGISM